MGNPCNLNIKAIDLAERATFDSKIHTFTQRKRCLRN